MIERIMSFLNPILPLSLAVKGLEKISPKMKNFFGGALASGYSANEAMEFLRDQFSSTGSKELESQEGVLRPDEEAALGRQRHEQTPSRIAQGVATTGAALAGGAGLGALTDLGMQAQNTVQQGEQQNAPQQQVAAPQVQQSQPAAAPTVPPTASGNFISKHPELGKYLDQLIKSGQMPERAASLAKGNKKFASLIEKIESDMGQPFEDLIAQLYTGSQAQQGTKQPIQTSKPSAMLASALNRLAALRARK